MQQTFICPKCGGRNFADQQFCGSCGAGLFGGTKNYEWPPLHILALDQSSKLIVGFRIRSRSTVVLPAITTDGKLSMIPGGDAKLFHDLQKRVRDHINSEYSDCQTHVCFCLNLLVQNNPKFDVPTVLCVWNASGSPLKIPEMDYFYDTLSGVKMFADNYWHQLEQFFNNEPQKSWINNLIMHLKKENDWANYVAKKLSQYGFDYTGKWTDEVWVSGELERL
jgi:hypothetical protein